MSLPPPNTSARLRIAKPMLRLEALEGRDVPAGTLAVHAFFDANNNGAWDGGEAGAGGVTVSFVHTPTAGPGSVMTASTGQASAGVADGGVHVHGDI